MNKDACENGINVTPQTVRYSVTGMTCAACQAHVEKAVSGVEGVTSCAVSLLTDSMSVEGNADPSDVIEAVKKAGYGASVRSGKDGDGGFDEEELKDKETPKLIKRLVLSVVLLAVLMYFSMGVMMFGWPSPFMADHDMTALVMLEMILSAVILVINRQFFTSGIRSLIHGGPNMDTLVSMGAGISYLYSLFIFFRMTAADHHMQMELMNELYFESAAMIVTIITVGKTLESFSKGRTTNALKELMKLAPDTATVIRDGRETVIPASEVRVGDEFIVKAGESIPVDGIVIDGNASVNESALTGESIPVDKEPGDRVSAACISTSGYIRCTAERVGEDTTLSEIIRLVRDASSTKAPIARIADKVSAVFVPAVIAIAAVVFIIWILTGAAFSYAMTRAITVLVVSCPCALGLATPVAIMVSGGVGARNGILFKSSEALEVTGKTSIAVLDKTGTLTKGEPSVTDVLPAEGFTKEELLYTAFSLEKMSEHPLGKAVTLYCEEGGISSGEITGYVTHAGNGLEGELDGTRVFGGNALFISSKCDIGEGVLTESERLSREGKTPLFFSAGGKLCGIIAVSDVLKDDSVRAVSELKNLGLRVLMVTGDNEMTAKALSELAGVDETAAGILPGGKEGIVRKLKTHGRVLMVGDGINDAPALVSADIGMAVASGTDVAIGSADVVLMRSSLSDTAAAIRLSRRTLVIIYENLFWAFIYNILLIPIAAGVLAGIGVTMSPMLGAAAMSLSSFTVCMNALRLNLFRPHDASRDRRLKNFDRDRTLLDRMVSCEDNDDNVTCPMQEKKEKTMTRTLSIEGMMCGHCEATVKKALEGIDGVSEAAVSHEKGTAVVTLSGEVSDDVLRKAVEDRDYKVLGIE